ncbi:hypothetical protein [Bartonella taylorii]|uniref:hypothetical protein n=1 Tax=Bartonella taylorii TaxID=33046 RepID=UPI001ABAC353|nr:hypothetical protein [Bartonella taylorii]
MFRSKSLKGAVSETYSREGNLIINWWRGEESSSFGAKRGQNICYFIAAGEGKGYGFLPRLMFSASSKCA